MHKSCLGQLAMQSVLKDKKNLPKQNPVQLKKDLKLQIRRRSDGGTDEKKLGTSPHCTLISDFKSRRYSTGSLDRKVNFETKKMNMNKGASQLDEIWICEAQSSKNVSENSRTAKTSMIGSQGDSANGTSVILHEEQNKVFLDDFCPKALNALTWEENEEKEEQAVKLTNDLVPKNLLQMPHASFFGQGMQVEFIGLPLLVPITSGSCKSSYSPSLRSKDIASNVLATNKYFSTPVPSKNKMKKYLTPVKEMDLEFSSHETPNNEHTIGDDTKENKWKCVQFPDLLQYGPPISEELHLYTPLYQSCFEAECLEIVNKLECVGSNTTSPSGLVQRQTLKGKQGIVDVSTIETETLPYESTPMKYLLASEAGVLQPVNNEHLEKEQALSEDSVLDLEKMNLQFDVRESVCKAWEGKLDEEPLPPYLILKTLEELPSIEGIGILGNIQNSANGNSREQEKVNAGSLETITAPALNPAVDLQTPLESVVPDLGTVHGSFNVPFNLSQKLQTEEQTGNIEFNQTHLINHNSISSPQCVNLTFASKMQTDRLTETGCDYMNEVRTVLHRLITSGTTSNRSGYAQKAQDETSSKESNGGFHPDMVHSLPSMKPHNTETTHNESVLSLGSLTFLASTLITSTPLSGEVTFQFMKNIYGDSVHRDLNLSVCSVTEEHTLDTGVNQKSPCKKSAGIQGNVSVNATVTTENSDEKPKLEILPQNSCLSPWPQICTGRSLIQRAGIPTRSKLPTSRRCLALTIASEGQSASKDLPPKGRGTIEMRKSLARHSLGKVGPVFQKSSAASNRHSLAGVGHAGMLSEFKEADFPKTEKRLGTIGEMDAAAPLPNMQPVIPLTSRLTKPPSNLKPVSKLPVHVSSQLSFGGRVSHGSAPQCKGAENVPALTSVAGGRNSGIRSRPSIFKDPSAACSAKISTTFISKKSSVGKQPAATGRNMTFTPNRNFKLHAASFKKARKSDLEQTRGPSVAETQDVQITDAQEITSRDFAKDAEGDIHCGDRALTQLVSAVSRRGKNKPEDSDHQPCLECLQNVRAKAELLCQLETVQKKLADREMHCKRHMERLWALKVLCENYKKKIHSLETSGEQKGLGRKEGTYSTRS